VPAAIHLSPEVLCGGPLGKLRDGDLVRLDSHTGTLEALVPEASWQAREHQLPVPESHYGMGRELFAPFRALASTAEQGGGIVTPKDSA
jgi:phosphogluconate dehydratase